MAFPIMPITPSPSGPIGAWRLQQVFKLEAQSLRFDHQTFNFVPQQRVALGHGRRRHFGDRGSNSGLDVEQTFVDEGGNHLVGRVRVDLELLAQRAHRREPVAGPQLPACQRLLDGVDDLPEKGQPASQLDREGQHSGVPCVL